MKKRLLEDIKTPVAADSSTGKKTVPWGVVGKVKSLLVANKSGIWVSRFLMEYKVSPDIQSKNFSSSSIYHTCTGIISRGGYLPFPFACSSCC